MPIEHIHLTITEPIRVVVEQGSHLQLAELKSMLQEVLAQGRQILMTDTEALAVIKKVDDATTEQGKVLEQESVTLHTISDEIDALIAKGASSGLSSEAADALQKLADHADAVSTSLKAQAEFSTQIASKGSATVPPVPPVTPPPA